MGVQSLNELAVDGPLNTTNQPTNQPTKQSTNIYEHPYDRYKDTLKATPMDSVKGTLSEKSPYRTGLEISLGGDVSATTLDLLL